MHFAQTANPFFHRMQIVADYARVAHFPLAPFLRHRRDDTVLVDIQSKIEFFFHWCVCLFSVVKTATLRNTLFRPLVRLCSTLKRRVARENMNGKLTALFNPV